MPTTSDSIVQKGDPVLRKVAKEVPIKNIAAPEIKKILHDMQIALEACDDGVAIAAPQIGVSLRIFVVSHRAFEIEATHGEKDAPPPGTFKDMIFINPEITKVSRKKNPLPEGCLSVRWLYGNVSRHEKATIRAVDEQGKKFTYGASGLLAQIFQHETDHLNGVLFIDTATELEHIDPNTVDEHHDSTKK